MLFISILNSDTFFSLASGGFGTRFERVEKLTVESKGDAGRRARDMESREEQV